MSTDILNFYGSTQIVSDQIMHSFFLYRFLCIQFTIAEMRSYGQLRIDEYIDDDYLCMDMKLLLIIVMGWNIKPIILKMIMELSKEYIIELLGVVILELQEWVMEIVKRVMMHLLNYLEIIKRLLDTLFKITCDEKTRVITKSYMEIIVTCIIVWLFTFFIKKY